MYVDTRARGGGGGGVLCVGLRAVAVDTDAGVVLFCFVLCVHPPSGYPFVLFYFVLSRGRSGYQGRHIYISACLYTCCGDADGGGGAASCSRRCCALCVVRGDS